MKSDFIAAINQVSSEKGLSRDVVIDAIESALVKAYERGFAGATNHNVIVRIDRQSGQVRVLSSRQVVEQVADPKLEVALGPARASNPGVNIGDSLEEEITPGDFGRIAAQTAKQVVLQKLREAERDLVYDHFANHEGDILTAIVQRVEPNKQVVIDLGRAEAVMPPTEQVPTEVYRPGQRLKVYLVEINRMPKGPQIVVSRTHRNLVRRLFELEVPEVFNGVVEIRSIAREPGSRSKVAVSARQEGVDPVGACVGLRGVRIQTIVTELNGEKIDVVQWSADNAAFVGNALSPAQVVSVSLKEAEKTAVVLVPEKQLSLAIGREGQNARLAAKLTGWRIDIKPAAAPSAQQ
jgi:N utilization substance protein A